MMMARTMGSKFHQPLPLPLALALALFVARPDSSLDNGRALDPQPSVPQGRRPRQRQRQTAGWPARLFLSGRLSRCRGSRHRHRRSRVSPQRRRPGVPGRPIRKAVCVGAADEAAAHHQPRDVHADDVPRRHDCGLSLPQRRPSQANHLPGRRQRHPAPAPAPEARGANHRLPRSRLGADLPTQARRGPVVPEPAADIQGPQHPRRRRRRRFVERRAALGRRVPLPRPGPARPGQDDGQPAARHARRPPDPRPVRVLSVLPGRPGVGRRPALLQRPDRRPRRPAVRAHAPRRRLRGHDDGQPEGSPHLHAFPGQVQEPAGPARAARAVRVRERRLRHHRQGVGRVGRQEREGEGRRAGGAGRGGGVEVAGGALPGGLGGPGGHFWIPGRPDHVTTQLLLPTCNAGHSCTPLQVLKVLNGVRLFVATIKCFRVGGG